MKRGFCAHGNVKVLLHRKKSSRRISNTLSRACSSGRLHQKSFAEQDFGEIAFVPACDQSFVFDSHAAAVVVFEQAQGRASQAAEVGVGVPLANAALVFLERHIQLPVTAILDRPMTANRFPKSARCQGLAQNVIAYFARPLAIAKRLIHGHPDGLQFGPALLVGDLFGNETREVPACLFTPMRALLRPVSFHFDACEVVAFMILEVAGDAVAKRLLVAFDGQHVIGVRIDDRLRDCDLTSHRVDRDQTAGKLEDFQQVRESP